MFDLQAGIHFQKIKGVAVLVENEFDGAGVAIMNGFHEVFCGGMQVCAHCIWQVRRRGFFQHFLVTTLGGAIPFAQGDSVALAIAENLHFDMAGPGDIFFDEDAVVGKIIGTEAPNGIPGFVQAGRVFADLHADAAAASGALEHDRVTNGIGGT